MAQSSGTSSLHADHGSPLSSPRNLTTSSFDLDACKICLVNIALDCMTFDFEGLHTSAADVQELVLLYPVHGEDPLAPFRKAWSVSGFSASMIRKALGIQVSDALMQLVFPYSFTSVHSLLKKLHVSILTVWKAQYDINHSNVKQEKIQHLTETIRGGRRKEVCTILIPFNSWLVDVLVSMPSSNW